MVETHFLRMRLFGVFFGIFGNQAFGTPGRHNCSPPMNFRHNDSGALI